MGQDITFSWSAVIWQPYLSALASTSPLPGFSPSAKWLLIPPLSGNELSVLFPRTDEVSARCRPLQYRSLSVVAGLGQFELPRVLSRTPQKHLPQNNLDLFFVYIEGFSESVDHCQTERGTVAPLVSVIQSNSPLARDVLQAGSKWVCFALLYWMTQ